MGLLLTTQRPLRPRLPPRGSASRLDAVGVAAFAIAVSAAGAARPSLWYDEAATISASHGRSLVELGRMLANVDAVHGLYYLVMHGWFAIFPTTEFWSRLSSGLAVGIAAAGVVVLARHLTDDRTVAVVSGLLFAVLPRITWAGIEARSYAMATAVAVWLTVLVVTGARRHWRWKWSVYAAGLVAAVLLNLFLGLMVLTYAVAVPIIARRRETAAWWAAASALALLIIAPFAVFTEQQVAQVSWIPRLDSSTITDVLLVQYFDHSVPFAVLAGLVVVVPLVRPMRLGWTQRRALLLAGSWIVLPTGALLLYSALREPIYFPRYLCFTSPAVALLLAVNAVALTRNRRALTVLVTAFVMATTPAYLTQRGPYAKEGMDFSQVADVLSAHAERGDCLILDNTTTWMPGPIRPLTAARPSVYATLVDPGRGTRAADRNLLWDAHVPIWRVMDRVSACTVLWTVSQRDASRPDHEQGDSLPPGPRLGRAPAYRFPERLGFHVVERWQFHFAQIVKSSRW